ncbi:hypothetical protein BDN71DRAFT_1450135 [Pleurotus eryngii]|uniref:Uncharacterized protein n=1 Tax=Pleurotus eryngii TaxID=5323 RepID=A0A9P5ZWJ2_PLEER|nr:hypothetical protein BDN71DRAFT_1450135 [Pleurotus eryngii]
MSYVLPVPSRQCQGGAVAGAHEAAQRALARTLDTSADGDTYTGAFHDVSGMNHTSFHRATLSMQLYAVRNIIKSNEKTTSYCTSFLKQHTSKPARRTASAALALRISGVRNGVPSIVKWEWVANPLCQTISCSRRPCRCWGCWRRRAYRRCWSSNLEPSPRGFPRMTASSLPGPSVQWSIRRIGVRTRPCL